MMATKSMMFRVLSRAIRVAGLSVVVAALATGAWAWPGNGHGVGGGNGGGHGGGGGGGGVLIPFAGCGTVVEGVECLLFAADSGGTYIVGLGGHSPGDRIFVQGQIDQFCVSYCQQGDGCIVNATISDCTTDGVPTPPTGTPLGPPFSIDDLASLLDAWGSCGEGPTCPWDLNGDGLVNARDLVILVRDLD